MSSKNQKVILNQTVAKLGIAGDVVEVKPGFARNFLLPRAIAAPWSQKAQEKIEQRRAYLAKKFLQSKEDAIAIKNQLEKEKIVVPAKTGAKTTDSKARLFGSVKGEDIAKAIKDTFDVVVAKQSIETDGVIKTTGPATATAHLFEGVTAQLKISVVAASKK